MCGEKFWKGIIVFCLTFWVGSFASGSFFSAKKNSNTIESQEVKKPEVTKPFVLLEPSEVKPDIPRKPTCKKYNSESKEYLLNLKKIKELENEKVKLSVRTAILNPSIEKELAQRIEKIDKRIAQYKKRLEGRKSIHRETEWTHNLLYVENCGEY